MKENTAWILTYLLLVAAFAYMIGGSLANWSAVAKTQRISSLSSPNDVNTHAPAHSSSVSSKNCAAFFTTSTSASLLFQKP